MSEILLEALMQLFALLTDVKHTTDNSARTKVEEFLALQFNTEYVRKALERYDFYLNKFHAGSLSSDNAVRQQQTSANLDQMNQICQQVNLEIDLDAKMVILSSLLNYILKPEISTDEEIFVDTLADNLRIPPADYWSLKTFTLQGPHFCIDKERLLLIDGSPSKPHPDIKHIYVSKQRVQVWVLHIKCTNTFFYKYDGERNLYMNGHKMEVGKVFPLKPGSVLNTSSVRPVYYGHVAEKFITKQDTGRIIYRATDIEYRFGNNNIAIHKFSFLGKSGQLVGIMGGSGTGKSTLINVMNGNFKPSSGTIKINGFDLHRDKKNLEGVIGYVPQDDTLNEELTVYENLAFNARLVFSDKSHEEQAELVEKAISEFDLVEARDLKVGTPLNKILSGGQRKRLNIALELMREPSVLFVDEPTSGLSSIDSEKVMRLLKRQVLKGKLVIINIHQPGSDLYKLLDKLLIIDQGGRIVYNGNPMNAIVYFKRKAHYVNPEERECYVCGNVKTEQPLHILEARMVDPSGKLIRKRKVSAEEWYQQYCDEFEASFEWKYKTNVQKEKLPENLYSIPGRWSQFKTFAKRDALKKVKDKQYLLINLFEVPILAFLLAYATKYIGNTGVYSLAQNTNIPTYLFMCVVVAIFVGLNVSAEEIIKDRKLLMREQFLNLSRSSYLNSKILNLMTIAAFQSLMLVIIGNTILEIPDMWFGHWAILFSTFSCAIMLGLNISSGLQTAVSIYISIPLVIVPQLLFSGTMVNFDKLQESISHREYTPVIGDLMISRWSYEALAVDQFCNNDYEQHFYAAEQARSTASYAVSAWIPVLQDINENCRQALATADTALLRQQSTLLKTETQKLLSQTNFTLPTDEKKKLFVGGYAAGSFISYSTLLDTLRALQAAHYDVVNTQLDSINNSLIEKLGSAEAVVDFRNRNVNNALADLALNRYDYKPLTVYPNQIVRKRQPIYAISSNLQGRAHLYAPTKNVGKLSLPTPIFNCIVIWLFSGVMYFTLYFDLLRRLLYRFERLRKKRLHEQLQRLRI